MLLLALSALALAVWLYLAFAHGGFWRAGERLEPAIDPPAWPEVVAVIPARNEADSIGAVIAAHMATDYPGVFSLIVVDDDSSDGTADLARAAAADGPRRLEVIAAPPLAPGWTGKLAALRAGIAHAERMAPAAKYLLLTDADIVHAPFTLRRLVARAEGEKLVLASLMARLDCRGLWGELLIPAFIYFFQKLYPFPVANDPARKLAAGAGGCMLVRREALAASGGLDAIKDRLIDDCALADRLKNAGPDAPRAIWIGLAKDEVVSLRDNSALSSVWRMVARTAFAQLNHSWLLLVGTTLGMALVYLTPPAIALSFPLHGDDVAGVIALGSWCLMAATYLPTVRLYGLPRWRAALLPVAAVLYSIMTVYSGLTSLRGSGGLWKGRTYP